MGESRNSHKRANIYFQLRGDVCAVALVITIELYIISKRHAPLQLESEFILILSGEALTGHIISLHQTRSELDCAHKCLLNSKCASLNFEFQSSRTLSTCEINGMSRASSTIKLQRRDGFAYYEPIAKLIQEKEIDTIQSPIQQG